MALTTNKLLLTPEIFDRVVASLHQQGGLSRIQASSKELDARVRNSSFWHAVMRTPSYRMLTAWEGSPYERYHAFCRDYVQFFSGFSRRSLKAEKDVARKKQLLDAKLDQNTLNMELKVQLCCKPKDKKVPQILMAAGAKLSQEDLEEQLRRSAYKKIEAFLNVISPTAASLLHALESNRSHKTIHLLIERFGKEKLLNILQTLREKNISLDVNRALEELISLLQSPQVTTLELKRGLCSVLVGHPVVKQVYTRYAVSCLS